jgi:signal transduction histidine kinase
MQTPLAVIRSKIDLLLQSDSLQERELKYILNIEDASQKLARLHQSLLLLAKIENRQFNKSGQVDIGNILHKKASELADLFIAKKLTVKFDLRPAAIFMNPHLAEILAGNLLTNALRYTPGDGTVVITLNDNSLSVSNTAANGCLEKDKVFRRFYKADEGQEGTGLGLAIIKEICVLEGFDAGYNFENGMHIFSIYFKKPE